MDKKVKLAVLLVFFLAVIAYSSRRYTLPHLLPRLHDLDTAFQSRKAQSQVYTRPVDNTTIHFETEISKVDLLESLVPFANDLRRAGNDMIVQTNRTESRAKKTQTLTLLDPYAPQYLQKVAAARNFKTVICTIPTSLYVNLLDIRLYNIHSNDCHLIKTTVIVYSDFPGLSCDQGSPVYGYVDSQLGDAKLRHSDLHAAEDPLGSALGGSADVDYPTGTVRIGHVHVIRNAHITTLGDVITDHNYVLILRCLRGKRVHLNPKKTVPHYIEVYTIAQFWGSGYFHAIVENLPRIVLALPFLRANIDVKVHVSARNAFTISFLEDLGISRHRLVSGVVSTNRTYLPEGTSCGSASQVPISILSRLLRPGVPQDHKDRIVLIKRSAKRWFGKHSAILRMLEGVARTYNISVSVFGDKPPPSMATTRRLFGRALVVVGPHGAGLSNIVFSAPGTCVVEGLCYDSRHRVNMCYKHLAQVLGHIYHGVVPRQQCFQIGPDDLKRHVQQCLSYVKAGL